MAILFICTFLVHIVRINSKKPISSEAVITFDVKTKPES